MNVMELAETDIDAEPEDDPPPDGAPLPPDGAPPPPEEVPPPPDDPPPPEPPVEAALTIKPVPDEIPASVFTTVMDALAAAVISVEGTEAVS